MNSKIWDRDYFLQTTSDMESDSGKIKGIAKLNKFRKKKKNGSMMLAHKECAKRTLNSLALLTKNCNVFSLGQRYSNTTRFSIFINKNFSPRIHTTDIIPLWR